MIKNYHVLFLILIVVLSSACSDKKYVDIIVYDADVYTVDDDFEKVSAFAIKDGIFIALGDSEFILDKFKAVNYIDAGTRPVYPGFNDGHSHFMGYGLSVTVSANLVGTSSFDEVVDRVIGHCSGIH